MRLFTRIATHPWTMASLTGPLAAVGIGACLAVASQGGETAAAIALAWFAVTACAVIAREVANV